MNHLFRVEQFTQLGLSEDQAKLLSRYINQEAALRSAEDLWLTIAPQLSDLPWEINLYVFKALFPMWPDDLIAAPVWAPTDEVESHLQKMMQHFHVESVRDFQQWSFQHFAEFWEYILKALKIIFKKPYTDIGDFSQGIEKPIWLKDAKLNITDSCFLAPQSKTAIIYAENNQLKTLSYDELNKLSNQVANSLLQAGLQPGDAIAIAMPMNYQAVAIYLGIIKMGGIVVSVADSFSPEEIAIRLTISRAKAIFTQDVIPRGQRHLPLYEKVKKASSIPAIVLTTQQEVTLREMDYRWSDFLIANEKFTSFACDPMSHCNILFSSGTTGEPKAIPWTHVTPIKVASDAYLHHDVHTDDVIAWPTNLGWMMGPWLIFAALMNQATLALYDDVPRDRAFGEFIEKAKVSLLGVVPTLVASWRQSKCMENLNWLHIRRFASTGECSNPEDMFYLMWLAKYKPVIEYCGGTEIGGAYITSTLLENNYPSVCTTPAFGSDFILFDEAGSPSDLGEVGLLMPSLGYSTELLNADHHQVYFQNMPESANGQNLRRHGDQLRRLANGCYTVLGRADDTMNLGAIKTSSAEIERVLVGTPGVLETAAIATQGHGPSALIIFAATQENLDKTTTQRLMQDKINKYLNPLFKISDVVFLPELPKTASNKIMRRLLRKQY